MVERFNAPMILAMIERLILLARLILFQECKENCLRPVNVECWNYFKHDLHIICLMIHLECRDDADRIFSVVRLIVRGKCGARSAKQRASGSCYDYCGSVFMESKVAL